MAKKWQLVEHVQHKRKRAGFSSFQSGRYRDLTIHGLKDMARALAVARSQAEALYASAVDAGHDIELADGDLIADQQCQGECTTWDFPDGSRLVAQGPDVWAEYTHELGEA